MSAFDPSDADVVDPLADDPLAFLYEPGDEDEDNPPEQHPGYGSLMGISVGGPRKTGKVMAIVLDEHEALRASEVMEINAGQLMTNPDRSGRQIGFQSLGLDAGEEEEEEDDLAESLTFEADAEEDDGEWQPENPLAGTGMEQDDDEDHWQPENPLAGTEFQTQDDGVDWQPVSSLTAGFIQRAVPEAPAPEAVEQPPAPGPTSYAQEAYAWTEPTPLAGHPVPEEPALEDEQAWSAEEPVAEEAEFAEVEWEAPLAAVEPDEEPVAEEVAAIAPEAVGMPAEVSELDEAEELPEEPTDTAPIAWQSLMGKKRHKEPALPPPTEWDEWPAEEVAAEYAPVEPVLPAVDDWQAPVDEPVEAPVHDWQQAAQEPFEAPAELAEPEWQSFAATEEPVEFAAPTEAELPEFAAEETAAPYGSDWSSFLKEGANDQGEELSPEFEPEPPPQQIEIVRFPAPPVVEAPHHSLRARVLKSHEARVAQPSLSALVAKWFGRRFRQLVLPLLNRVWAWAKAKWQEIAARAPRD